MNSIHKKVKKQVIFIKPINIYSANVNKDKLQVERKHFKTRYPTIYNKFLTLKSEKKSHSPWFSMAK